jgi:hypothetical protein
MVLMNGTANWRKSMICSTTTTTTTTTMPTWIKDWWSKGPQEAELLHRVTTKATTTVWCLKDP